MTIAPSKKKSAATTSSALFWLGLLLSRNEARRLHEIAMTALLLRDPLGVLLAFERSGVVGPLLHQLLPLRCLLPLTQNVDVVAPLVLAPAARHEDAAQHEIVDVKALLLASGDVAPRHLLRHLLLVRHVLLVEYAQRLQLPATPVGDRLDRVVDRRVDMLADQLHGEVAAALERDVRELGAGLLLDGHGDDLVFLPRTRPRHLELAITRLLRRFDVLLGGLVRRVGVHPEDEFVQRHHLYRREVLPAEWHTRG